MTSTATSSPSVSVIFTTYNQPAWLHKVLVGFEHQTFHDFEVIIADDGSGEETEQVYRDALTWASYPIERVWMEDTGYHKCDVLNMAIERSRGEYLVFTDGDCIPRADFLEVHWQHRSTRHFLSGAPTRLPMGISTAISDDDIASGHAFDLNALNSMAQGEKVAFKHAKKLSKCQLFTGFLNRFTTAKASWNGCNASCYKAHIVAVNGMDERMKYGGQDRELGERLNNLGLRGRHVRYKAIAVHLDHKRGYVSEEGWRFNNALRRHTRNQRITWTPHGLLKQENAPAELLAASRDLFLSSK